LPVPRDPAVDRSVPTLQAAGRPFRQTLFLSQIAGKSAVFRPSCGAETLLFNNLSQPTMWRDCNVPRILYLSNLQRAGSVFLDDQVGQDLKLDV
jgi:hypothetical protein